ncbi:MAG: tetratricopeptide repeat protein [Rhodospirillales bacterium]|nr:tetratricopeptide repeat protein [Rhodospirillales bacterium]
MSRKERRRQQKLVRQGRVKAPGPGQLDRMIVEAANLYRTRRADQAGILCRRILDADPRHADAHNLLSIIALEARNGGVALKHLKAAVRAAPDRADLHNNLGNALTLLERNEEAAQAFAKAGQLKPGLSEAHYNHGQALRRLKRHEESEVALRRALDLTPDDAMALNALGMVLKALSRPEEALQAFRGAAEARPGHVGAWLNLANLLILMVRDDEAINAYERVLAMEPENPEALTYIYRPLQSACTWDRLAELDGPLDRSTDRAIAAGLASIEEPFLNVSRHADPARNLSVARSWAQAMVRGAGGENLLGRHRAIDDGTITVGYMSTDFRDHPVAHLVGDLLSRHSRPEFRIVAISAGTNDDSFYRRRIEKECDRFIDIRGMDDSEAARQIADQGIDILVDLTGHTRGTRLAVCARRPAPIQVTWLGYPGTTGADFMDYIIADPTVLPEDHAKLCTEKVVYMPGSYQVNGLQTVDRTVPSRAACGLPEDAFVFSSFCQTYKIDRPMFATWLDILSRVPDSVLWLLEGSPIAEDNLRRESEKAGVAPDRIVFAGKLPKDKHLARTSNADMGLDTRIYGGHTTTSDLLLAGVPVVSLLGDHFASRVGASVLRAAGLEQLIANDLKDYRDLAVGLAATPTLLNRLRRDLITNRSDLELFDCDRFCRNLETAFRRMWTTHIERWELTSFAVADG